MIVYLYYKCNAFMSYLYFITKVIILKMFIHTLLVLTHRIVLKLFNNFCIYIYKLREFKLVFHLILEIIYDIGIL